METHCVGGKGEMVLHQELVHSMNLAPCSPSSGFTYSANTSLRLPLLDFVVRSTFNASMYTVSLTAQRLMMEYEVSSRKSLDARVFCVLS